jgi:hypothetical protein
VLSAHFAAGGSSATPHSSSCSLPLTTPGGAGPKPVMHVIGSVSPRASWMTSIVRQAPRSRSRLLDCMNLTRRGSACRRTWPAQLDCPLRVRRGQSFRNAMTQAEEAHDRDVAGLADLEHRLDMAAETVERHRAESGRT